MRIVEYKFKQVFDVGQVFEVSFYLELKILIFSEKNSRPSFIQIKGSNAGENMMVNFYRLLIFPYFYVILVILVFMILFPRV